MANYLPGNYWPTDYWTEDYWPEASAPLPLIRTEPVTYLPNSYYVKGYWADIYWPVASEGGMAQIAMYYKRKRTWHFSDNPALRSL